MLGQHKGIICYTIGQRKGLGLALHEPMYVCRIDPKTNTVVLGRDRDLWSKELTAKDFSSKPQTWCKRSTAQPQTIYSEFP